MTFYSEMAEVADELITEFGQVITINRYAPTVVGSTGVATKGAATATSTANAIVLPASKGTVEAFDNRRDTLLLSGRKLRYLKIASASMTFEPDPLDEAVFNSATWQVLGCTPVNPAGTPLVYGIGVVKL